MIIEFTGIPGAGKSTIIHKVFQKITNPCIVVDIEGYIKNLFFISLPGTIGYDIMLLFNFYRLKYTDYILMLKSIKQLQENKNALEHKINIFRNIFKKLVINRILLSKNKCFIVDEGISHIPISLFVDIYTQINMSKAEAFYKYLPPVNKVLLVDADHKRLVERVIKRGEKGHARIDFSIKKNIELFMLQSRTVIEISKKKLNPQIYHNNDIDIDLDKIIKLIGIKNV
mgnify:CR=1 FL=1